MNRRRAESFSWPHRGANWLQNDSRLKFSTGSGLTDCPNRGPLREYLRRYKRPHKLSRKGLIFLSYDTQRNRSRRHRDSPLYLWDNLIMYGLAALAATWRLRIVSRHQLILPGTTAHAALSISGATSSCKGSSLSPRSSLASWSGSVSASASTPGSKYSEASKRLLAP